LSFVSGAMNLFQVDMMTVTHGLTRIGAVADAQSREEERR